MRRSARSPERASGLGEVFREGLLLSGAAVARSPVMVGGTTAFLVAMGFVTANALWYQPHFHSGAFFETRTSVRLIPESELPAQAPAVPSAPAPAPQPAVDDTAAVIQPMPEPAIPQPQPVKTGDPNVLAVQRLLAELNLYSGEMDGLTGPQTTKAVENYRRIVGLGPGGIDQTLTDQLGLTRAGTPETTASIDAPALPTTINTLPTQIPAPAAVPAPATSQQQAPVQQAAAAPVPDPKIVRVQAGLRAFGNDGIELDGVVGARTRSAIKEFQSLFGLPETGDADEATYNKMREIGLTD